MVRLQFANFFIFLTSNGEFNRFFQLNRAFFQLDGLAFDLKTLMRLDQVFFIDKIHQNAL